MYKIWIPTPWSRRVWFQHNFDLELTTFSGWKGCRLSIDLRNNRETLNLAWKNLTLLFQHPILQDLPRLWLEIPVF